MNIMFIPIHRFLHAGDTTLLPFDASGTGKRDLGRNGSYMVMRQLQQDVDGYWNL